MAYIVEIGDVKYLMEANWAEASSPILVDGRPTGRQVASFAHSSWRAATELFEADIEMLREWLDDPDAEPELIPAVVFDDVRDRIALTEERLREFADLFNGRYPRASERLENAADALDEATSTWASVAAIPEAAWDEIEPTLRELEAADITPQNAAHIERWAKEVRDAIADSLVDIQ